MGFLDQIDKYKTVHEIAYEMLREAIVTGHYRPGERLVQDQVAEELRVSRMPIREAMKRLEAEGLVLTTPHRGSVVAPISLEDMEETYLIREQLESLATRLAVPRVTDGDMQELVRIHDEIGRLGSPLEIADKNKDFHFTIYNASGRSKLVKLISSAWQQSQRYRYAFMRMSGRGRASSDEHARIIELVRERNADGAAAFMAAHIRGSFEFLRENLGDVDRGATGE